MEERLKQRLVGAIVLVSLAVVFVPMLLDTPHDLREEASTAPIPERPQDRFESEAMIPLGEPETPRLDAEVEREHGRYASGGDAASRPVSSEAPVSVSIRESTESPAPTPAFGSAPAGGSDDAGGAAPAGGSADASASAPGSGASPARSEAASPAQEGSSGERQPAAASNGWAVQLGSFRESGNALALRDRLRAKGYPSFIESGTSAQGRISRVFVGPASDRGGAEDSVAKLRREMRLEGIVVPYRGG